MTSPLDLASRGGLPSDIAYLRAAYARPAWRADANFGELADFWLHVHQQLRAESAALAGTTEDLRTMRIDATAFVRAFVPGFNGFLQHLDGHHRIEDAAYFPKFRALDPRMVRGFDLLEADHAAIYAALEKSVDAARALVESLATPGDTRLRAIDAYDAAAGALVALLHRHLADEEELVIPALLEHGERSIA